MDIGRALGRDPVLTADHDGRLVASLMPGRGQGSMGASLMRAPTAE
jgi:hypothetical protein